MKKLPSISSTYASTFKLFASSFLSILPLALAYVALDLLLMSLFDYSKNFLEPEQSHYLDLIAYPVLIILLSILLFSCILYGTYQKHRQVKFSYNKVCLSGLKYFLPITGALLILTLPFVAMSIILNYISDLFATLSPSDPNEINLLLIIMSIILALFFIAMITWLIMCFYFYVTPVLIAIKNEGVISSLKLSWKLVRGHWFKTFFLLFLLVALITILQIVLFMFVGHLSGLMISLVILPLHAALMIIHYENLAS